MGDRSDHRSASHDFFARVARRGGEASQAPVEAHGPARLDLTYPGANSRTFGSDPGYGPGGGFYIDEFPVPASLVAEVAEGRGTQSGSGRRRGLFFGPPLRPIQGTPATVNSTTSTSPALPDG